MDFFLTQFIRILPVKAIRKKDDFFFNTNRQHVAFWQWQFLSDYLFFDKPVGVKYCYCQPKLVLPFMLSLGRAIPVFGVRRNRNDSGD